MATPVVCYITRVNRGGRCDVMGPLERCPLEGGMLSAGGGGGGGFFYHHVCE